MPQRAKAEGREGPAPWEDTLFRASIRRGPDRKRPPIKAEAALLSVSDPLNGRMPGADGCMMLRPCRPNRRGPLSGCLLLLGCSCALGLPDIGNGDGSHGPGWLQPCEAPFDSDCLANQLGRPLI